MASLEGFVSHSKESANDAIDRLLEQEAIHSPDFEQKWISFKPNKVSDKDHTPKRIRFQYSVHTLCCVCTFFACCLCCVCLSRFGFPCSSFCVLQIITPSLPILSLHLYLSDRPVLPCELTGFVLSALALDFLQVRLCLCVCARVC